MHKLRVAVIRGGPSSEYDVSLKTGASVLKHMPDAYQAYDILISKDGAWHREGMERTPDRALTGIDVVFNALHGYYGEDGKIQKILDHLGIPYTGSGTLASALGMNKILAKKAFEKNGIKTPYFTTVDREDDRDAKVKHVFNHFLLPVVVKPASAGSSIGVSIVKNFHHLAEALEKALAVSETAIVEEFIKGREATCGVINNFRGEETYALLPTEVSDRPICPGNFSDAEKQEIQRLAKHAHELLGLRHYSESDFIVHPRRGIYLLEVNTLPSLAPECVMPQSLEAIGCSIGHFLDHLIKEALG